MPALLQRHRDLTLHLATTALTSAIPFSQSVAVGWTIYERTASPLALGLVGLFQFLPVLALFLITGHIADRYPRKRVIQVSLLLTTASTAGLALATEFDAAVGWFYAALALSGCAQILNRPARDALLATVAPPLPLARAVALGTTIFQIASVSAPAIAGAVLAAAHSALPIHLANTAFALLSIALMGAIHRDSRGEPSGKAVSLADLLAGLHFVWAQRAVMAVMTVDMVAVLFGGAVALLPAFAKDVLAVGPAGLGLLSAAPAAGAVLVSLLLARIGVRINERMFLIAVAGFGGATLLFGLSTNFWLSLAALLAVGAFDSVSVVIRQTVVQTQTPDALRGRVAAVNRVFISSSNELGAVESGLAAAWIGAVPAVVAGGVITLLVVAVSRRVFPQLRHLQDYAH